MSNKKPILPTEVVKKIATAAVLCGICSAFTACGTPAAVNNSETDYSSVSESTQRTDSSGKQGEPTEEQNTSTEEKDEEFTTQNTSAAETKTPVEENSVPATAAEITAATTQAAEPAADSVTVGEKNALKKAKSYTVKGCSREAYGSARKGLFAVQGEGVLYRRVGKAGNRRIRSGDTSGDLAEKEWGIQRSLMIYE